MRYIQTGALFWFSFDCDSLPRTAAGISRPGITRYAALDSAALYYTAVAAIGLGVVYLLWRFHSAPVGTEVAVLLQIIADRKPGALAPEVATMERYRLNEWLNFIATEIHKGYNSLWHPELGDAAVAGATATPEAL